MSTRAMPQRSHDRCREWCIGLCPACDLTAYHLGNSRPWNPNDQPFTVGWNHLRDEPSIPRRAPFPYSASPLDTDSEHSFNSGAAHGEANFTPMPTGLADQRDEMLYYHNLSRLGRQTQRTVPEGWVPSPVYGVHSMDPRFRWTYNRRTGSPIPPVSSTHASNPMPGFPDDPSANIQRRHPNITTAGTQFYPSRASWNGSLDERSRHLHPIMVEDVMMSLEELASCGVTLYDQLVDLQYELLRGRDANRGRGRDFVPGPPWHRPS